MAKKAKESSGDILKDLEAKYGVGRADVKELTIVSTGSIQFNKAMKIGGSAYRDWETDRKSTRLNSSHRSLSRMPSSA